MCLYIPLDVCCSCLNVALSATGSVAMGKRRTGRITDVQRGLSGAGRLAVGFASRAVERGKRSYARDHEDCVLIRLEAAASAIPYLARVFRVLSLSRGGSRVEWLRCNVMLVRDSCVLGLGTIVDILGALGSCDFSFSILCLEDLATGELDDRFVKLLRFETRQISRFPNVHISKFPNFQISNCPNFQTFNSPNFQVSETLNLQIFKSSNLGTPEPRYRETSKSRNLRIPKCPNS